MFDRLRGSEQAGVERGRTLELFDDLLPLLDHAVDRRTLFALRLFVDELKHLVEARDLFFGLAAMLVESGLQVRVLGSLGHFRQGRENFLFGVIDIPQGFVEQFVKLLRFFLWHGALLLSPRDNRNPRRSFQRKARGELQPATAILFSFPRQVVAFTSRRVAPSGTEIPAP